MLKLATVFSGIGAIEHALNRMGIDHEIVFACDNGDIDILTKDIGMDIDLIGCELQLLESIINKITFSDEVEDLYKVQLNSMLQEASEEYKNDLKFLGEISGIDKERLIKLLEKLLSMPELTKVRTKEYGQLYKVLESGTDAQKALVALQAMLKIYNDYKKENVQEALYDNSKLVKSDGIDWNSVRNEIKCIYEELENNNGRRIIRRVQDLSQRTSQLHEKINYMQVQSELSKMGTNWAARKKYVDNLYAGQEKRNKVKQSYMANYNIDEGDFHWNVAFLDGKQYCGQVDLFVGGSPCQSFSLVGKQRGLEDTRGTLFYEYARLVDEIKPKVFIYENVKAVISHDGGATWRKMRQVFDELGYSFSWQILNAKNYGIPQNRERLFVVGFRNDLIRNGEFEFPEPIELTKKMKDFLMENAPGGYFLPQKGVEFVTKEKNLTKKFTQIDGDIQLCQKKNQQFNWHGDFVFQSENEAKEHDIPDLEKYYLSEKVRKYVLSTGTKNFYSRPKTDLDIARPLLTTMHKMHRAGVDNYVTTEGRLRKLTPRECMRLMGFSDEFKIVVSDTAAYQQAGNSIVVDILIHIMESIIDNYPKLIAEQKKGADQ